MQSCSNVTKIYIKDCQVVLRPANCSKNVEEGHDFPDTALARCQPDKPSCLVVLLLSRVNASDMFFLLQMPFVFQSIYNRVFKKKYIKKTGCKTFFTHPLPFSMFVSSYYNFSINELFSCFELVCGILSVRY